MKSYRWALAALAVLCAAACSRDAKISGTLTGAPDDRIVVKQLEMSTFSVLDTIPTDARGAFSYKVPVRKGQPEFIYLYHGDDRIAALLLEQGDDVKVQADLSGKYTVEGSEESRRLQEIEQRYSDFMARIESAEELADVNRLYIQYYRESVKYLVDHPYSLTVVPLLFQELASGTPIFGQTSDAIRFRAASDSLAKVYPDSRYVKSLQRESERRTKILETQHRLTGLGEVGFPDLELPGIDGKRVALSSLDAKVVFVYFWTSQAPNQTLFNLDFMKPLYDDFHDRGLEIYAICLDTDKALWASIVKNQGLSWVNVNDGLGVNSTAVLKYNVQAIPALYVIEDGTLISNDASTEAELRSYLQRTLR